MDFAWRWAFFVSMLVCERFVWTRAGRALKTFSFFFSFHTAAALRGSRHGAAGARNKIKKREKMFDCMVEGCGRRQI
jgi:hypothetical protein